APGRRARTALASPRRRGGARRGPKRRGRTALRGARLRAAAAAGRRPGAALAPAPASARSSRCRPSPRRDGPPARAARSRRYRCRARARASHGCPWSRPRLPPATPRSRGPRRPSRRDRCPDPTPTRSRPHRRIDGAMKLGLSLGYAPPGTNPADLFPLVQEAERLGFDSVWVAEAWGTDAGSVLGWLAGRTEQIKLGSAIMQIPGRTPANTAMTAATLDLLSGGRFLLGLGTSGPQVVEGWHGEAWGKPLEKTREYVEIVRMALRRETVEHHGAHYRIPWDGPGATGLGKPLKLMLRPLRAEVPIYLAALGPKNVALAAEIADGWLPIFVAPESFDE